MNLDWSRIPFQNKSLVKDKVLLLENIINRKDKIHFKHSMIVDFHGVNVCFRFNDFRICDLVSKFEIVEPKSPDISIYCHSIYDFPLRPRFWDDEIVPDCWVDYSNVGNFAIQRDFIAFENDSSEIQTIVDPENQDGFFNVIRWALPRRILKLNKAVLHSSCVVGRDGMARFFLGPSNAGKTTVASLADGRIVLGDDMNILSFCEDGIWASGGGLGGVIESSENLGRRFPVAGFYWLVQDEKTERNKLSGANAAKKVIISCANLFISSQGDVLSESLINFGMKITKHIPVYELRFRKNKEIWNAVE